MLILILAHHRDDQVGVNAVARGGLGDRSSYFGLPVVPIRHSLAGGSRKMISAVL